MKGHGYVTLPSRQVGAVLGDSDVSTDRPQRHPLLGDSEVDPTLLCGFSLGWSGKLGEPLSVDSLSSDCGSFHCCSCKGGSGTLLW